EGVEWRSAKSPKMHGMVSTLEGRHFLHWDDPGVDMDAWLDFSGEGEGRRLHMAKLDPEGDFSSDYEDLAFTRVGGCTPQLSPAKTMDEAGPVDIPADVPAHAPGSTDYGHDNTAAR